MIDGPESMSANTTLIENMKFRKPYEEKWKFYVLEPQRLIEYFKTDALGLTSRVTRCEQIYFDRFHPNIHFNAFIRATRQISVEEPSDDPRYTLEYHPQDEASRLIEGHLTLEEATACAREYLSEPFLTPIFSVTFERHELLDEGLTLTIDHDMRYKTLLAEEPLEVGREAEHRVTLTALNAHSTERAEALIGRVESLPCTRKKWIGFYWVKSLYEVPRHDELSGFEYEVKLDADHLNIDFSRLPFPTLEVFQSDSRRLYYNDHRACQRGAQAHIVEKGPVEPIKGILKRPESKEHGFSAWSLDEPLMEMHRYKREVNVFNPDSGRVYTLSLHYCVAQGGVFHQLEIEYDGRLVSGVVEQMARFRRRHNPKFLYKIARKADQMGWTALGSDIRTRATRVEGAQGLSPSSDHPSASQLEDALSSPQAPQSRARIERYVVRDMRLLRKALIGQGFRASKLTKRKWLKTLKAQEVERAEELSVTP